MRLFHVSEKAGITVFHPRPPERADVGTVPLVWAIDEAHLPNYLTPRDCPRVTYHVGPEATDADIARFFSSPGCRHVVAIEHAWFPALLSTEVTVYEFDPAGFTLQDEIAGYYVSAQTQALISATRVSNLSAALFARGVELRVVDLLWPLGRAVQVSSLRWSLCRMRNAQPE